MRSLCPRAVLKACAAAVLPVCSPLTSHTILLPGCRFPLLIIIVYSIVIYWLGQSVLMLVLPK
ncbi:hypothetical protein IMSAGC005_04063 [Lachnospiraceae bacterium]|nr:hypothetical protein IMSAGC005_04063 [Lachnospiraceae bacterium]